MPSGLIVAPGCGWHHVGDAGVRRAGSVGRAITCRTGGVGDRPVGVHDDLDRGGGVAAEVLWASSRTATDSDPLACQPAPDSAVFTFGAKAPRTATTTTHPASTVLKRLAVQSPRRPAARGGVGEGRGPGLRGVVDARHGTLLRYPGG